jgi:peptidoglycan/xylan/chitin deacetylase (PgdA/CDA1 family)
VTPRIVAALALMAVAGCGNQPERDDARHPTTRTVAAGAPPAARPHPRRPRPRPRIAALPAPPRRYAPGARHDQPVPILMYHVITAPPAGTPYPELWVPWSRFKAQMRALRARGYRGVTLGQVFEHWRRGLVLPRKPIVLSFDDGYLSHWSHAARTLRALGWPGVLDLEVKNLGLAGGLSRRQVRELVGAGWEVAAHSITHPDLTTVGPASLRREVAGSRTLLRRALRVPVDFFCYPAGRYDAPVEAEVRAAGYLGATTTQPGLASPAADRFALPRIRVNGTDTAAEVLARLAALGA